MRFQCTPLIGIQNEEQHRKIDDPSVFHKWLNKLIEDHLKLIPHGVSNEAIEIF